MQQDFVRATLIEVLQSIQKDSGLDCPPITGATKPTEMLPNFDSKIWPVAVGMLASGLGITIGNDVNIFCRKKTCIALTIDETVAMVVELAQADVSAVKYTVSAK